MVGTKVKVEQTTALDVANEFFRRLFSRRHTVEPVLREIRMSYLQHGNPFGFVYTPYCWVISSNVRSA